MPKAPPAPPAIPDYALLRLVGRGSYGDVWLARSVTGVFRAIKLVWRERFDDAQPYEREFRGLTEFAAISILEARQLALLHVGRNDEAGFFYYVMEPADDAETGRDIDPARYVPNTLKEVRARRGRIPAAEVIALGADLARALTGLHQRGLVHRDIKPSNVILVGGVPKLADIGLVASASAAMTFVGTEGYVPPEGPGAPAADVYSLGKLLYELATGMDRNDYPRLPPSLGDFPDRKELLELNEVIVRACEPDARKRHRDASALLEDLLLLQAGRSVRRLRRAERSLARTLRVAAVLAVIASVAGAGAYVERRRAGEETLLRRKAEAERDALAHRVVYSATLTQAQQAVAQEDYGRARALLEKARPDLRGIEWRALWSQAQGDAGEAIFSGTPAVLRVVADRRGTCLAVLDREWNLHVIEAATGRSLRTIENVVRVAGFSPDDEWVVGFDRTTLQFTRWAVRTAATEVVGVVERGIEPLGLTPDQKLVAFTARPSSSLTVFDARTGQVLQKFPLESAVGTAPWDFFRGAISRDGKRVILDCIQGRGAGSGRRLIAFDLDAGRAVWDGAPPALPPNGVGALDSTPAFVLSAGLDGRLFQLPPGAGAWQELRPAGQEINLMVERPDAPGTVLCAGKMPVVYEIKLDSPEPGRRWRGHGGRIQTLLAGPDAPQLITGSTDGKVRRWPLEPSIDLEPISSWDASGSTTSLVASPDGGTLLAPLDGNSVGVISTATWQIQQRWPGMRLPLAWQGNRVWSVAPDGCGLEYWDVSSASAPQKLRRLEAEGKRKLVEYFLSADQRRIAAGLEDGRFLIWSTETGQVVSEIQPHQEAAWGAGFCAGGTRIWSVASSKLTASNVDLGTRGAEIDIRGFAWPVISPDESTLALIYIDGRLELRSPETGQLLREGVASPGLATFARYTPDGKRILVGGAAGTLHVISAADATVVTTLGVNTPADIVQATVAPDGQWLAVANSRGKIVPWPMRTP